MKRHVGIQFIAKSLPFLMVPFFATQRLTWPVILTLIASTASLFHMPVSTISGTSDNLLELSQAETIRVSLYGLNRPDSIRITGSAGTLILYSESHPDTLSTESYDGSLRLNENRLIYTSPAGTRTIDSLAVYSDSSSTRLITDEYGYRHYSGDLHIKADRQNRGLTIINAVDLETYVASVVGSEMDFENPEALKAQAVVSRTYALWSIQKSPYNQFDLRDHESNQVYFGNIRDKPWYAAAAEETKGEILTWSNQLILAVFSSTCGGRTANNADVWGGTDHPYLSVQDDAGACSLSPHYRWTHTMPEHEFKEIIADTYGFSVSDKIIEKDLSGRVQKVMLSDSRADTLFFTGNEFRLFINRFAGPMAIRSTKYDWTRDRDSIVFEGNGLGHGVGLCQWGTLGFARAGWNYKDILTFYFSGTKIVSLDSFESNTIRLYN